MSSFSKLPDWLHTSNTSKTKKHISKNCGPHLSLHSSQVEWAWLPTSPSSHQTASQIQFFAVTSTNSPCPQLCREPKSSRCTLVTIICRSTQLLGHQPRAGVGACSESFCARWTLMGESEKEPVPVFSVCPCRVLGNPREYSFPRSSGRSHPPLPGPVRASFYTHSVASVEVKVMKMHVPNN